MLEITRISLPKDAPAAKGRCARGTGRHWPKPQRLGTEPDGGLLGRLPGTPRVAALFRPPKKKTGTAWAVPVAVCAAGIGRSRHHRPTCSAANTGSEALLPSREDAMLEITRISLPKDAPAAKGRYARGTGRHWPEPQRLGTTGRRIARQATRHAQSGGPLPPPKKENGNGMGRPRCRLCSHRAFPPRHHWEGAEHFNAAGTPHRSQWCA